MKDPADNRTASLIPEQKKRGPKPTGKALTPAQRKAAQRARDRERSIGDKEGGKPVTVTGLIEAIADCAKLGFPELLMQYAQQLADRIREKKTEQAKQANHVTVTDPEISENP